MTFKTSKRTQTTESARGQQSSTAPQRAHSAMPRYLTRTRVTVTRHPQRADPAEAAAESVAQAWVGDREANPVNASQNGFTSKSHEEARALAHRAGAGTPLPARIREDARTPRDADSDQVRVHTDSDAARIAKGLGASAVTAGHDIFFAHGRYSPESTDGQRLLAHELAHVAQQGGEPRAVQCDLAESLPVTLGVFEIDMITQAGSAAASPGLMGTIKFDPDPMGPYAAEIGLVQAVNVTDVGGATTTAGQPVDWSNVNPGGANPESGRNELMTPGTAAPQGWFIDANTAMNPRGSSIGPNYIQHWMTPPPANQFGWLRSPTDFGPASLWDYPQWTRDSDFDFETVAKSTDNQVVYGALHWGFQIRSAAVAPGSEYAHAEDNASATFEEALERFRGYFVHEPVVLYFDTNDPFPRAGEEAKLADVADYLDRYPDVTLQIDGYADIRGTEEHNYDLSQQRADAAANLLELQGVDPSRIDHNFVIGWGETQDFSQHGTAPGATQPITAGRLQANRRVVISFSHNVSGYPIVMP